jgi:mono/diheme cytochrome c family protein
MMKNRVSRVAALAAVLMYTTGAYAAKVVETIEIEGMVSPASPKALSTALEEGLAVKVLGFNFYGTASGWPSIEVEYDDGAVSRDQIEKVINSTDDPTGTPYAVHKGDRQIHLALLEEETEADGVFSPDSADIPEVTNPIPASAESNERGEKLYLTYCAKCHGITGNGAGPSAHGFSTDPRQLWAWHNADKAADPYLFWFITNGRTDMPPWGVILSENERWDLVNYIKTIKPPEQ